MRVFDKSMKQMVMMKFLRLNVNDDYNYGMGGADIIDQIRRSYRYDHWLRNFKWWHSICWWGVQMLMVNSYKFYCKYLVVKDIFYLGLQYQEYLKYCKSNTHPLLS